MPLIIACTRRRILGVARSRIRTNSQQRWHLIGQASLTIQFWKPKKPAIQDSGVLILPFQVNPMYWISLASLLPMEKLRLNTLDITPSWFWLIVGRKASLPQGQQARLWDSRWRPIPF